MQDPIVGFVVTISPRFNLYRIVVLPAASRPTTSRVHSGSCGAAATECGADAAYCASHPFVRVRRHGLFVALHNSYFAATVATKAHVAAFARTRGWNRTRHKAYGVREFSASGIQYYDDFAADRLAPVSGWWPPRERQDARRILVPVHFFDGPSGAGWRLAADAGIAANEESRPRNETAAAGAVVVVAPARAVGPGPHGPDAEKIQKLYLAEH